MTDLYSGEYLFFFPVKFFFRYKYTFSGYYNRWKIKEIDTLHPVEHLWKCGMKTGLKKLIWDSIDCLNFFAFGSGSNVVC